MKTRLEAARSPWGCAWPPALLQPWALYKCGNTLPVTALSRGGNVWDLGEISPASGKNEALQRAHGKEERCISRDRKDDKPQSIKGQKMKIQTQQKEKDSGKQKEKTKLRKG